jgi:rhamnose utilization protein RhaD (predicted bifunctional aldolase and dehydrogenase)/NAD(P)-dependent dehydrogenase (short-subunit alcohol dehydrogenase family)
MHSRWSDVEAARCVERYGPRWSEALALRTYTSRLLGAEAGLVLHGGGNTSLKGTVRDLFGDEVPALFVKASGGDLASIEPEGHVAVRLDPLRRWPELPGELDDEDAAREMRALLFDPRAAKPSIEAPVHAAIAARYVDHTHADAVLALTNRPGGEDAVRGALGDGVVVLPYITPGHPLAKAVAAALAENPGAQAMVWMHHGLITWGETARESYELMIELVSRAEAALAAEARAGRGRGGPGLASRWLAAEDEAAPRVGVDAPVPDPAEVDRRVAAVAPVLRGLLAAASGDSDRPWRRVVLRPLTDPAVLALLAVPGALELAVSPPLTGDHLIRTRALPMWVDGLPFDDPAGLRERLAAAVEEWAEGYRAYVDRHRHLLPPGVEPFDPLPRVVLIPGLGALCAGTTCREAQIARDITAQTVAVKAHCAAAGVAYQGLSEEHLFAMEYRPLQLAKLRRDGAAPLAGTVALVTGAAGAIGAGVAEVLAEAGAAVALTDLPGKALDDLERDLRGRFPGRILAAPLDVTDPDSVAEGFAAVARAWGGVDLVVVNAGLAHVSTLEEMDPEAFRRLERVNVEGTLLVLRETARLLRRQGTGGDIVLVSTKNVFAPGASFGAYSATKAAAHQLARIASLELAPLDVRVNMVAPDAVFGHGDRRSGLWAAVGPDRMRARGLDEEGLERYYRDRNLLKARVTARHVGRAVLFFATRQTPTTGATLPVDGGLPDATPR